MVAFNKYTQFAADLANGLHALGSDTLNVLLATAVNNVATSTVRNANNVTEAASGNGYTTNGLSATRSFSAVNATSQAYQLSLANLTFTATGGGMASFRYPVLYNSTKYTASATSNVLIGYWDYGSVVTLATGETFTVGFDAANGVIQLA